MWDVTIKGGRRAGERAFVAVNRLSWHGQQLALVCACHRGRSTENLELKLDVERHPEACELAWGELGRSAEKKSHAVEAKCMGSMHKDSKLYMGKGCAEERTGKLVRGKVAMGRNNMVESWFVSWRQTRGSSLAAV